MTGRIAIIGGNGQIGRAVARRFVRENWQVTSIGRTVPANRLTNGLINYETLDRRNTTALRTALGSGVDILLDCLSFDAQDAEQLLTLQDCTSKLCAVSSASVYTDPKGRTLDEAASSGFPDFGGPLDTDRRTVPPGPETYSTRKAAMECRLFDGAAVPVSVLRPCAIYGPYSNHAREWFFVKRLIDGRRRIPLAYGGATRFHTTASDYIAEAVWTVATSNISPILNVVDPEALTTAEIGAAIMTALGIEAEIISLKNESYPPGNGANPWGIQRDMICVPSPEVRLIGGYRDLVPPTVSWLRDHVPIDDWQKYLPVLAAYPFDLFDYEGEDALLEGLE